MESIELKRYQYNHIGYEIDDQCRHGMPEETSNKKPSNVSLGFRSCKRDDFGMRPQRLSDDEDRVA